jgi:hypothetical protein
VTRRLQLKAMREAAATVKAFAESAIGKELRETVRRFSESDSAKEFREAVKGFAVDHSTLAGLTTAAKEAKEALAGLITEDEVAEPEPSPRPRGKGGRPSKHDWDGARQSVADYIKKNGLPPKRQRLIEVVRTRLGGDAPDDREIRRMVDQFYPKQKEGKLPPKVGKP